MKDATAYAKKFATLYKKLKQAYPAEPPEPVNGVTQIIIGFLEWEATRKQALDAFERMMAEMVDVNDVRVTHEHDLVALIGEKYPRVSERVARMRDVLHEIFRREHATSLAVLDKVNKKQSRTYLDTLPGIVPYVSAQVMLLCLGAHAVPVDETLAEALRSEDAVAEDASVDEIGAFLERQIKAGEAVEAHAVFRAWIDQGAKRVRAGGARKASGTTRKTKTARKSARATSPRRKMTAKKAARKK